MLTPRAWRWGSWGRSDDAPTASLSNGSVWQGLPQKLSHPCFGCAALHCIKVTPAGSAPAAQGLTLPVFPDKQRPVWSRVALYNMSPPLLPNASSQSLLPYRARSWEQLSSWGGHRDRPPLSHSISGHREGGGAAVDCASIAIHCSLSAVLNSRPGNPEGSCRLWCVGIAVEKPRWS